MVAMDAILKSSADLATESVEYNSLGTGSDIKSHGTTLFRLEKLIFYFIINL